MGVIVVLFSPSPVWSRAFVVSEYDECQSGYADKEEIDSCFFAPAIHRGIVKERNKKVDKHGKQALNRNRAPAVAVSLALEP
jgi:hypothetical protein